MEVVLRLARQASIRKTMATDSMTDVDRRLNSADKTVADILPYLGSDRTRLEARLDLRSMAVAYLPYPQTDCLMPCCLGASSQVCCSSEDADTCPNLMLMMKFEIDRCSCANLSSTLMAIGMPATSSYCSVIVCWALSIYSGANCLCRKIAD